MRSCSTLINRSTVLFVRLILTFFIFFSFSCQQADTENENEKEEEKGEAIRGFELWTEMRTYPNSVLNARSFAPGFNKSISMSLQSRATALGMELPNTAPWTELAPKNFAGRVLSIAFHPTNPNIMFVGSASGGIWKTTNGGTGGAGGINWQFVPTGFPVLGVSSIVINPLNPNEIYAGTGEVYNNPASVGGGPTGAGHIRLFRGTYGIGIIKSVDGGLTWTKTLDFSSSSVKGVMDMWIHPTTPSTVWAGTTDGIYRTTNSGASWTLIHNVANAMDFCQKPGDPNVIYVGSGNFGSAGSGIYKTVNANAATPTFTKLTSGLPASITGKTMLSISANNTSKVYASVGRHPDNAGDATGLYYSNDEGANWIATPNINASSKVTTQGWYAHDIAAHPANANIILWAELNTWRATNGGTTTAGLSNVGVWSNWNVNNTTVGTLMEGVNDNYVHADVHRISFSPHDATGNTIFMCTDGGIFRSTDGGLNYQTLNGGLNTAQIYSNMAVSPVNTNYMLIGLQDNEAMVYEGNAGCRRIGSLGDGFHAAIKSTGTIQIVESYYFNRRRSTNSGSTFGGGSGAVPELACFNVPMVYSRTVPSTYMFAGTIYFKRSVDDGANWTNLNGGAAIAGNNNPIISMDAPNNSTVYFSTSPGGGIRSKLWRTTNATVASPTFTEITGILPDRYYSDIAVDPTNANRLAVAVSGFGSSHVYLSTNGGTNWTDVGAGLPDVPANTVVFDPINPTTLYIGNDIGVFYANNVPNSISGASYGLTWTSYNEGFTDAILVSDLLVTSTGKIRMGSYGRGLWERDLAPSGTLPAKIRSFSVNRQGNANELTLEVTEELNIDKYVIEYSPDGQEFTSVADLAPKSGGQGEQTYRYAHITDRNTAKYYRIRIVDIDGRFEYTRILKVNAEADKSNIYLYPNPTRGIVNLHIAVKSDMQAQMRVIGMSGKVVRTKQISLKAGVQEITTDLSGLPDGTYRVILDGPGLKWSGSIIKTK